jgi:uncharacterized membrane protein HdeD (DUF308 family)
MSEGQKTRWAQFSLRQAAVCATWYAILVGIVTAFRPSDQRLYLFLLVAPIVGVSVAGCVVLFAPNHRRWLMPLTIGLLWIAAGVIAGWLAALNSQVTK